MKKPKQEANPDGLDALRERYVRAAYGVQTGIATLMQHDSKLTSAKHMRVGIDMSKADMGGLTSLLIDKGVFTLAEYLEAVAVSAEKECADYESAVSQLLGANIRLG